MAFIPGCVNVVEMHLQPSVPTELVTLGHQDRSHSCERVRWGEDWVRTSRRTVVQKEGTSERSEKVLNRACNVWGKHWTTADCLHPFKRQSDTEVAWVTPTIFSQAETIKNRTGDFLSTMYLLILQLVSLSIVMVFSMNVETKILSTASLDLIYRQDWASPTQLKLLLTCSLESRAKPSI